MYLIDFVAYRENGVEKNDKAGSLSEGELLFEKYRIEKIVGRGGYGRVYKARDTLMDRDVAVKELLVRYADNPLVVRRFIQEARSAGKLQHPNIVTIFNLERSVENGRFFLIMEFIDGASLRQICRKKPKLRPGHVKKIAQAVLSGLAHAHAHSIIHRDIKPDNIMVTTDERVKIADFGVAKLPVNQGGFTQLSGGVPAGTAAYLSPEQIRGEDLTFTSDLYSCGVTLYELTTGQFYFEVENCKSFYEVGKKILHVEPPRPREIVEDLPEELDELICKLLIKDATARIQSATEALEILSRVRVVSGKASSASTAQRHTSAQEALLGDDEETLQVAEDLLKQADVSLLVKHNEESPKEELLPLTVSALNELRWSFDAKSPISQILPSEDVLFVATENGVLFLVCRKSGRELWKSVEQAVLDPRGKVQSTIALSRRYLAAIGADESICLYDWQNEKIIWKRSLEGEQKVLLSKNQPTWDPRTFGRKQHLFWYGNLLYLFTFRGEKISLDALELDDGATERGIDTGLPELVDVLLAPTNASELVEGHLWAISKQKLVALDLLSSKVLREKSALPAIEQLSFYGYFPKTNSSLSPSGVSRESLRRKKNEVHSGQQYYSGYFEIPLFLSLEALEKNSRVITATDATSLETLWTKSIEGGVDPITRFGSLQEVLFSELSIYVICDRSRSTLLQLDISSGEIQAKNNFGESIIWMDYGSVGYVVLLSDGTIAEYSFERNELLWSYFLPLKGRSSCFQLAEDTVFVFSENMLFSYR